MSGRSSYLHVDVFCYNLDMNNPLYFEIQADDPVRAIAFYKAVFGWDIARQEGTPVEYWRVETSGIDGGILQRPVPVTSQQGGTNAAVISMQVRSFDETANVILLGGGIVAMPKFAIAGRCWQGYFLDTEGNTFGVFEADEHAA